MTCIDEKARALASYVQSLPDFAIIPPPPDPTYRHMGATLADAILQPGIVYDTVVRPRVERLRQLYPQARTTSAFLKLLDQVGPGELLRWRHPEKPRRILELTRFLCRERVETEADLARWLQAPRNVQRLRQFRGIGDKTADYLKILSGLPTVAVDRHLFAFLRAAGIEAESYDQAHAVVGAAAGLLGMDRAAFDRSLWVHMSRRRGKRCLG